jgi:hypothetical protein
MRNLKRLIGDRFKIGKWYIIMVEGYDEDDYWLFNYYGKNGNNIIQYGISYNFNKSADGEIINFHHISSGGPTSLLCNINEINNVERISDSLAS